ncbi:putative membrane protein [Arthrobacter stackebrandtii]|uniref:Membrane protein n=1 Tax=Arthrobacter stackebrandtii TaxID=272161 RepID=A0ABS4YUZ3_9MICC|nr:DUF1304 domain-containing protein [Arthrobacter stackebrandtii]MBP2412622.1 putative membrane protein [Arthrobacter stackebrandtii]PYG98788.1 DUF1304 domain-containing protein [Arthrobacter stackebrandtii]
MLAAALVFAGLAALVHVYIFVLESLRWTLPATRKTFGTSVEQAAATRELAFNQGFYNLFLAIVAVAGIVAATTGHHAVGAALVLAGCGSMLAAGLVLLISAPNKVRAAAVQLAFPLVAVVLLTVWLAI